MSGAPAAGYLVSGLVPEAKTHSLTHSDGSAAITTTLERVQPRKLHDKLGIREESS